MKPSESCDAAVQNLLAQWEIANRNGDTTAKNAVKTRIGQTKGANGANYSTTGL